MELEDGEEALNDPPIPKCGSGAMHDPSSSCDMWSYESKCKAIFDLLINVFIAVTVFFDLFSFSKYFPGGGPLIGLAATSSAVFLIEMFMTIN